MSEEPLQLPGGHPGCDKACARPDDGLRAPDVPATRERATTSVRTDSVQAVAVSYTHLTLPTILRV